MGVIIDWTESNPGWLNRLRERFDNAQKLEVAVGFPRGKEGIGSPYYSNGMSVLQVAVMNNYGLGVPRRPFMNVAAKSMKDMYKARMRQLGPAIITNKITPIHALNLVGQLAANIIRKTITDGPWLPNSPATVLIKGSDKPLIDTGHMRMSVTYSVRKRTV